MSEPTDAPPQLTLEQRELAYYKRQVDDLAGESLKLDYAISGLRHELTQKRQGFALLARLQKTIGALTDPSSIFAVALPAISATLGMDRAVVLTPSGDEHTFRPLQWTGYRQEAAARFGGLQLEVPGSVANGAERMIVNGATPPTPFIQKLQTQFELPWFICVPVMVEERPIALIIAGRLREAKPLYPPLDAADLDTFNAIAGLIEASIRNMRVAVLEEMDRLRTQFFANISHEFRTPITLTIGPLEQVLGGRYGPVSSPIEDQLRMMRRNQERLLTLVNQILDLAKMEARQMRLRAVPTDVNRLLSELVAQFQSAAEVRGVALRLRLSPELDGVTIQLDREQFERMVINLCSNALKFTTRGFVELATELHDGAFRLIVTDTGIGIKEDQLVQIFDRFWQADRSGSAEQPGTGIGLALVREIARLHGGDVTVSSRYGEGTTFLVSLPLSQNQSDSASSSIGSVESDIAAHWRPQLAVELALPAHPAQDDDINAETSRTFDETRPTILYAEDNADLRRHVTDLLGGRYNVFVATDGRDALDKLRSYRPDLVLSDQMMPHMNGRELLRAIREHPDFHSVPVIILTAHVAAEARMESLEAGADDYLAKPFNQGELLARVGNLLRARTQQRTVEELNRRLTARVDEQVAELLRGGELQRFVPRAVAERVLRGDLGEGTSTERRKITVLHAAIAGFAELTDQLEPEDLAALTDEYFSIVTAAAVRQGGTADHVTTQGAGVLFGAPAQMAPAEQAMAAVQTAIEMRERVRDLVTSLRRRGVSAHLDLRAGIQTGFCTVGAFGNEALRSYTAIGMPVTIARLLEEDAAPDTIVCGAGTHLLLEQRLATSARGPRQLRGMSRMIESYEIADVSTAPALLPSIETFKFMPR